jgi:hypothetical protein
VVTSAGIVPARSARVKKRRAAAGVAPHGQQDVDDLTVLIDGPVEIGPLTGNLQVSLSHEPPVTKSAPARPGRLGELGSEALHPPVDGDVIDGDARSASSSSTSR